MCLLSVVHSFILIRSAQHRARVQGVVHKRYRRTIWLKAFLIQICFQMFWETLKKIQALIQTWYRTSECRFKTFGT